MSDAKTVIDKTLDVGQQIGDIASRAMSIRASKEIEILNQKKEKGIINFFRLSYCHHVSNLIL